MKSFFLNIIFIIIDVFLLVCIFYFTQYITGVIFFENSIKEFVFFIFIIVCIMFYEKIYRLRYDFWQETYKILKSLFLAYIIIFAFLALQNISFEYSNLFIILYFILSMFLIPIFKRFIKMLLFRFEFFKKRVLIIGDITQKNIFKNEFKDNWYLGMIYDEHNYDSVIILSKTLTVEDVDVKIEKYLNKNVSVYIVPYVVSINFANSDIMEYSNIRYNTIKIENKLLVASNILIKKIFDVLSVIIILPFVLPIHFIIMFVIKSDSNGSVFFRQYRLGENDKPFLCYKYRTMYENAEDRLREYLNKHPEEILYYETFHKYKNDPRITKIGKLLRNSSLDELAQIINILKGDMSLVGPRPYMVNESDDLGDKKDIILKVKPGITGLWQVSGRNNLTFKERNELEIWYIKNWSLWLDLVILIKTVKVVFLKIGVR